MSEPNSTDLLRRLDNLFRLGTILAVDHAKARVRVKSGEIESDWLPWLTFRAGQTQSWSPPTVGEQCLICAVSGELSTAVVLVGIYTNNAPSQNPDEHLIVFPDGAEIRYNHASGALSVKNCNTATLHAKSQITLDCPTVICTGEVQVLGTLAVDGIISTQASVTAQNDVSGGGISLKSHKHGGVESGNKQTQSPTG